MQMPSDRLTSWKAIAAVFGRDVRTVQRWEKEEGLPVHRHLHHRRHSVWATREELDAWWHQRGAALTTDAEPRPAPTFHRRRMLFYAAGSVATIALAVAAFTSIGAAPAGRWETAITILGSIPGASAIEVQTLRDLNGDGVGDLVIQTAPAREAHLYFGPGHTPGAPDVRVTVAGRIAFVQAAPVGDVDGDGLRDLVFSVFHAEPETYYATGPSYLVRGREHWPAHIELPRDADSTLYLDPGPDARFMACSADDGVDLNRDGLADVVIGGGEYSFEDRRSAGGVFVLFGRRAWAPRINIADEADVAVHGSYTGHGLKGSCASGDFTADGLPDLVLLATNDTLWGLRGSRGSAYLIEGRAAWPRRLEVEPDSVLRLTGERACNWAAQPRLADVNGDGIDDLVAAMIDVDPGGRGRVAIVFGSGRRGHVTERQADVLIEGDGRFGYGLAAADLDGDRIADLLVSEPDSGVLRLISGRRNWTARGAAGAYGSAIAARSNVPLGRGPFAIGDFDGDALLDVGVEIGTGAFGLLRPALPLTVDVRPNAAPNVLVPGGVVAVAVRLQGRPLEDLDISSLRAAGAAPSHVGPPGDAGSAQLYFDVNALRLPLDATRLAVVGKTHSGVPVSGTDTIVIPAARISSVR